MHRQNTCVWKRWVRKSINNNKHQTKHTKCKSKSYLHLLITVRQWRMTLILTKSDLLLISKMFILIQLDKANSSICFKIFNSPKRTLLFCFQSQKPLKLVSMLNRFILIFIRTKFTWIPVWYSLWVWSAVDPNGIIVGQLIWEYHRIPDILCQNQIKTQHTKRGAPHSSQNMTIKCTWLICLVLCRFCGSWTVAASTTNSRIPAQYHSRNTGWKC